MNEQTAKLIAELAEKLGTTAEHLWAVLVRQAPVSSTVSLAVYGLLAICLIIAWVALWRWFRKATSEQLDEIGDFAPFPVIIVGIATLIWCGCLFTDAEIIISGFTNPEYWALKQILK